MALFKPIETLPTINHKCKNNSCRFYSCFNSLVTSQFAVEVNDQQTNDARPLVSATVALLSHFFAFTNRH